ncbi:glucose-1-phosphate adenylyltransferase [Elusimicrobiota bacterium]
MPRKASFSIVSHIMAMVLAGGEGSRIQPLTKDRAKPAIPFGGRYRLIDFVLSNLVNSGIIKIKVLTQFKSDSLIQHITRGWTLAPQLGQYVDIVPAQMRMGPRWYTGSADAVLQSLSLTANERTKYMCILGADHVYRMDISQMLEFHVQKSADVTMAAIPQPRSESSAFGVVDADDKKNVVKFLEKPKRPPPMHGNEDCSLASMGIYIFNFRTLKRLIEEDSMNKESTHDFGRDIIPLALKNKYKVCMYDFSTNRIPGTTEAEIGYWRDIGSIDAYYKSSMDLVQVNPMFNLYNYEWPIFSHYQPHPPAKFVFDDDNRRGCAIDSIVSGGVIISGSTVRRSILSPHARIHSYCDIEDSIIFNDVSIGRHSRIRRAIIDKEVAIPPDTQIGHDPKADKKRFKVSPDGIVVVPRNYRFES